MKKKTKTIVMLMLATSLIITTMQGCKKENEKKDEQAEVVLKKNDTDKIISFISITTNMPKEKVVFDQSKKEFYISGTDFRETQESMQNIYDKANEYKFKYETLK